MEGSPQDLSVHRILQEYWSGLPFPPPGDPPNPGIKPTCLGSPTGAGRFITTANLKSPTIQMSTWKSRVEVEDLVEFSSVQSLSRVRLFTTSGIAARQASLSITNTRSSLKLMSILSVMPSSHLILCRPLLLLPPIPPSIRVFINESTLHMRCPKYWSFSFPSKEQRGLTSFRIN